MEPPNIALNFSMRSYTTGGAEEEKQGLTFICEFGDQICPLKVKADINPKTQSFRSYDLQFKPAQLARTNLLNFKKDRKTCNLPLYAISLLPRFVAGSE